MSKNQPFQTRRAFTVRRGLWALLLVVAGAVLLAGCLAAGDRDNAGTFSGEPGTFTEVDALLTEKGCADCHGSSDTTTCNTGCHGGLVYMPTDVPTDLTYAGMVDVLTAALSTSDLVVDPGSSETSVLYWVVSQDSANFNDTVDGRMLGLMGANGTSTPTFSAVEKAIIGSWIDDGAPEN